MAEVAVCIPTYNRRDIIEEALRVSMQDYHRLGYDVYVYDSSEDEGTENVVRRWQRKFENLYYVRMPSDLHSNMKVYAIFRKTGLKREYDFLWVRGDALRWTGEALDLVDAQLQTRYDMVVVNHYDRERLGTREYTDRNEFFQHCAWQLTLYGSALLNTRTMLGDVDWGYLTAKYDREDRVNHSHVAFYFEKILQNKSFLALHISLPPKSLITSSLKKHSGWRKETFYVWCHCWPETIYALPDYYTNKDDAIRREGRFADILAKKNFKELRMARLYNLRIYRRYKERWSVVTDVPRGYLRRMAVYPVTAARLWGGLWTALQNRRQVKYLRNRWGKSRLKRFCRGKTSVYIYGAGKIALRYAEYLRELGMACGGFIVTDKRTNQDTLFGRPVIEVDRAEVNAGEGIVLGLGGGYHDEVLERLRERGIERDIFVKYIAPYDEQEGSR